MKMLFLIFLISGFMSSAEVFARARTLTGPVIYTSALLNCNALAMPVAVQKASESALVLAKAECSEEIFVTHVKLLKFQPVECSGWNAGFETQVELLYDCPKNFKE